jgi:pimeloyl-ACP methyl ester carboxylesterase
MENNEKSSTNEIYYKAPKPRKTTKKTVTDIAIGIATIGLFPLVRFTFNRLYGEKIGEKILPSQFKKEQSIDYNDYGNPEEVRKSVSIIPRKIETHDGAILNTLDVKPKANPTDRWIIHLFGNAMQFADMKNELVEDALEGYNVIGFNFRGVGSKYIPEEGEILLNPVPQKGPKSKHDLYTDAIAQVQRLIDVEGADPKKIILKGHSLGAAVAAHTGAHYHAYDEKVYHFNGRSFSTLSATIIGILKSALEQSGRPILAKVLGVVAFPIVKAAMVLTDWEMYAASDYKSIPETHKDYVVVRSKKEPNNIDDGVIHHDASMHQSVKYEIPKELRKEHKLNGIRERKGHNVPLESLNSRAAKDSIGNLLDGQQYFHRFAERVKYSNQLLER